MPKGFYVSICRNCTTNCQRVGYGGYWSDDNGTLAISLAEVALTGVTGDVIEDAPEGLALEIGAIGIADEVEEHLLLLEHDLLDAQLFAKHAEGYDIDEFLGHIGDGTKAVDETFAVGFEIVIEVLAVGEVVEFAVEQHALGIAGDVEFGEVHLDVGLEGTVVDEELIVYS